MELAELERRKREDEACRPVPKLESRAGMRHAPSPNTAAIYSGLYSWKFSRENSLNDLKKKYEQRPSFSPTLYGRTVELARKRRSRSLSRSQSPSATARSQDARIAVPTPAVEFTPLHDHMSLTFSQLQGDQNEHHDDVRASSPLVASMEATTIGAHSGDGSIADTVPTEVEHSDDGKAPSSTVDGEGINFNIDETALQTLRTLQPTQPSTTTDADVARFFSPFSNRTLNVRLPQPQSSDSHPESFHESNHPELGQNSENYGDMNDRAISPLSENSFQIRYNQQHSPLRGRSPPKRPNLKLDLKLVSEQSVSSETVFDRLYAERNNKEAIQMELQKRHSYSHPHRPDIGSSSNRPIEKSTNAFFNRLYNHYAVRQQEILRRSIELQKMRELEVVDNSVCIPLGRQLESMER